MYYNNCGVVNENTSIPMKWHKFLVYFFLIYSVVINFIAAVDCLSGKNTDMEIPHLYTIDIIYGFVLLAFGIFILYVWQKIRVFKKSGQHYVPLMYAVDGLIDIVYDVSTMIVKTAVVGWDEYSVMELVMGIAANVFVTTVLVYCNKEYYDKRAHLFVN